MIYTGITGCLDDLEKVVSNTTKTLVYHREKFDFLAVTGMSGVIVGSPVSMHLNVPLVVVRKQDENRHQWSGLVNIKHAIGRYLFLDDFIAYGNTFRFVYNQLKQHLGDPPEYAGSYLYADNVLSWAGDGIIGFHPDGDPDTGDFVTVDHPNHGNCLR